MNVKRLHCKLVFRIIVVVSRNETVLDKKRTKENNVLFK